MVRERIGGSVPHDDREQYSSVLRRAFPLGLRSFEGLDGCLGASGWLHQQISNVGWKQLASGDAAAKRRLRLELASQSGGEVVAAEVRKRLATIAKSKSFVDWHKVRALAKDLEAQRTAIMKHVAPTKPADSLDLLWRLLEIAPSIYERCDDSNGTIGDVVRGALENLGEVAKSAKLWRRR